MAEVISGSVSKESDCRPCDLKAEFNSQINASSAVIIVVGNKTASRTAGSECMRCEKAQCECQCTPYKQNSGGKRACKIYGRMLKDSFREDICPINNYSYLRHEFEQAKKKNKTIIILYNSTRREFSWLPSYLEDYKDRSEPFWIRNEVGKLVGNYQYIKGALGYE